MDEMFSVRPSPPLRGLVAAYQGYRQRGLEPASHRGLPSPFLTVIFTFDVPLEVAEHPDPSQGPGRFRALVGGLHATPARIVHDGAQAGVQILLSPLGARALLGMPAAAVAGIDVHGTDVFGPLADDVCDRLQDAPNWPQRFAAVDAALTRRLGGERPMPSHALAEAWRRVVASGGQARVRELALELGWSERHLAQRFGTEFGMTPKVALRVARFDLARRRIGALLAARTDAVGATPPESGRASNPGAPPVGAERTRPQPLADVAATAGYADQSHLAREFHALAGVSPSRWVAEEFGNVQAGAVARPAESAT